jgi:hypothetical protein
MRRSALVTRKVSTPKNNSRIDGWNIEGRYWVRKSDGLSIPIIQGGGKAVTGQTANWAFGTDNGSESAHSLDTEGVNRGAQAADTPFLIRLQPNETGGASEAAGYALFAQKNGAGGYTEVTTSRTDGLRIAANGSSRSDDENTTERLTAGTGSFTAGKFDDGQTQQATTSITLNSQYTDLEFCIEIDSANAATDDYWDLRVHFAGGGALDSYSTLPRVTADTIVPTLVIADVAHTHALEACNAAPPIGPIVLDIDAETGDLTEWTSTSGAQFTNAGTSAIHGSYGFEVDLTGTGNHYGLNDGLATALSGKNNYRFRFYIDTTSVSMTAGDEFWIMLGKDDGWVNDRIAMSMRNNAGTIEARASIYDDSEASNHTSYYTLTLGEHYIEIRVQKSTGSNDGEFQLFFDGSSQELMNTLDNDTVFDTLDEMRWGAVTSLDTGTTGSYDLDSYIFRNDDTEIGAVGGAAALVVADVAHVHTVEGIGTLAVHNPLTVADVSHTHALEAFILAYNASLTVADISHTHALEAAVLVFHPLFNLAVDDVSHLNALEQFSLIYNANLIVGDIAHVHALEAFIIVYNAILQTNDIAHVNAVEAPALTYTPPGSLVVHDVAHVHEVENVQVIYDGQAAAAAIQHDHALEAISLTKHDVLVISDVSHTHDLEAVTLAYNGSLTVADVSHVHEAETFNVTYAGVLSVNDTAHVHTVEEPVLTFSEAGAWVLSIDDIIHVNATESPVLAFTPLIAIADIAHVHNVQGFRFVDVEVRFMHDHDDFITIMT